MKAIERKLYRRGTAYYYRSSLPLSLHHVLPFKEIVCSLGKIELTEARLKRAQLEYQENQILSAFWKDADAESGALSSSTIQKFTEALNALKTQNAVAGMRRQLKLSADSSLKELRSLFSDISMEYIADCVSDAVSTKNLKEKTFQMFLELIGDKPLTGITKNDARKFKALLLKIPANAKKRFKIKSLNEIDWNADNDFKGQHPKTVNSRLMCLNAFFNWAIKGDRYFQNNPFAHLQIKSHGNLSEKRHPFTLDELKIVFQSPVFTGCMGEDRLKRLRSGDVIVKDSLYWVPLIALYSGMRMNEICQLHLEDIKQEQGLFLFSINANEPDKKLKNHSSERNVPIHPEILAKGFLDYVQQQKKAGYNRVFMDIHMGAHQSYASVFSKRFAYLLKSLGIKRTGLCFHSFRHTFIDGMRNVGVERAVIMRLTGHAPPDVHGNYGHGYSLSTLHQAIEKLSFPILAYSN